VVDAEERTDVHVKGYGLASTYVITLSDALNDEGDGEGRGGGGTETALTHTNKIRSGMVIRNLSARSSSTLSISTTASSFVSSAEDTGGTRGRHNTDTTLGNIYMDPRRLAFAVRPSAFPIAGSSTNCGVHTNDSETARMLEHKFQKEWLRSGKTASQLYGIMLDIQVVGIDAFIGGRIHTWIHPQMEKTACIRKQHTCEYGYIHTYIHGDGWIHCTYVEMGECTGA